LVKILSIEAHQNAIRIGGLNFGCLFLVASQKSVGR
jgi:hypothetical protein